MLTCHNVSVRVGQKIILNNVTFSLSSGHLTAMVGRNGSGKSTLLACVNQQLKYTGMISDRGKDVASLSPRQRARQIALLPQQLNAPHITVREMAAFGRNPYLDFTGRLSGTDRQAIEAALDFSDAQPLAERFVDTLSGGERQRAALAMVLAQETPTLLLDEPTAHMDPACEAQLLKQLVALKRQGRTVMVVLHDLALACAYADDLIVLDGGRVVFSGPKEDCLAQGILERTFALRRYTVSAGTDEKIFFLAD